MPFLIEVNLASSISTPITLNPFVENTEAKGNPTRPKPRMEITADLFLIFSNRLPNTHDHKM